MISRLLVITCLILLKTRSFGFLWEEINHQIIGGFEIQQSPSIIPSRKFASEVLNGHRVYVSVTTIHRRLYGIAETLWSIVNGSIVPDHIYVFISNEHFLLDSGITVDSLISETNGQLVELMRLFPNISIILTDNIGPHRKLLPLLSKKWNEDCAIVTIDDHLVYRKSFLESLIKSYEASSRSAVVALRARKMGICSDSPPWVLAPYTRNGKGLWPESSSGHKDMLLLPTGTGGVLYRPRFFHPIVFDQKLINITNTGDDLMFRLCTLAMGIPVVTACAYRDALGKKCPQEDPIYIDEPEKYVKYVSKFTFGHNFNTIEYRNEIFKNSENYEEFHGIDYNSNNNRNSSLSSGIEVEKTRHSRRINTSNNKNVNRNFLRRRNQRGMLASETKSKETSLSSSSSSTSSNENENEVSKYDLQKDPRKIVSLATKFNNAGGNNRMWNQAVQYLHDSEIFDFEGFLQYLAPVERQNCLLSSTLIYIPHESMMKSMKNTLEYIKVSLQSLYSKECGINICEKGSTP